MTSSLTAEQLYRLNDAVTAVLAELGWSADPDNDEDDDKLNDAVLELAATFFPARATLEEAAAEIIAAIDRFLRAPGSAGDPDLAERLDDIRELLKEEV